MALTIDDSADMRSIVENMGLAWQVQHRKINVRFGSVITEMVTTGADGKQYGMTCLPLRKLATWLYSISPNKVAPKLRDKIVKYQEECDEVRRDKAPKDIPVIMRYAGPAKKALYS